MGVPHCKLHVSCKDVLTARLLASFHHEMSISAGAAPLSFNTLGIGASANDSVSASISGGIEHHPDIVGNISGMANTSANHALLGLPRIKHPTAHKARTTLSADDHAVLEHVKNSDAKSLLSFLGHAMVSGSCHGFYRR